MAWRMLGKLIENAERAMRQRPVRGEEENVGKFTYQGSVANRALELIGEELGMFIDRKEVGKPGDFADDELSRANKLRLAQAIAERNRRRSKSECKSLTEFVKQAWHVVEPGQEDAEKRER
jgi:hypothetical protein